MPCPVAIVSILETSPTTSKCILLYRIAVRPRHATTRSPIGCGADASSALAPLVLVVVSSSRPNKVGRGPPDKHFHKLPEWSVVSQIRTSAELGCPVPRNARDTSECLPNFENLWRGRLNLGRTRGMHCGCQYPVAAAAARLT
jgi:hypothetical protein